MPLIQSSVVYAFCINAHSCIYAVHVCKAGILNLQQLKFLDVQIFLNILRHGIGIDFLTIASIITDKN